MSEIHGAASRIDAALLATQGAVLAEVRGRPAIVSARIWDGTAYDWDVRAFFAPNAFHSAFVAAGGRPSARTALRLLLSKSRPPHPDPAAARGAAWFNQAHDARAASRGWHAPGTRHQNVGVRAFGSGRSDPSVGRR